MGESVKHLLDASLWLTSPLPDNNGYTWTLASRLGHMLQIAQERYGERDCSYTILGVEMIERDYPQIWYLGNCKDIIIQVTAAGCRKAVGAYYQLAHECIHLLSPNGGKTATILEEGLATHFAEIYMRDHLATTWRSNLDSYSGAQQKTETLLQYDPYAIRRLREKQPTISNMTPDLLLECYPELSLTLAVELTTRFVR